MAYSKVILNGTTLIDVTQKTVDASNLLSGYTALKNDGTNVTGTYEPQTVELQSKSVSYTPSETAQSATVTPDTGYDGLDEVSVSVGAISSTYVGSEITRRSSSDLTASGATVTVPSGYYSAQASKAVSSGSATTPATTITAPPTLSVANSTGIVTATISKTQSVTPSVSAGYVASGTAGNITVSGSNTLQLNTQAAATITPSTQVQTAVASGKFTTGAVTVAAMPTGTAGTPSATKGTVSNHAVSVTPSVTNTTGYITGGTKTGTAVSVSASELVSGTKSITENGTGIDVTNYASVDVNVSGGGVEMVTISVNNIMGSLETWRLPTNATMETDPDSPWISYITTPKESLIANGITSTPGMVSVTGLTFEKLTASSRPTSYFYLFYVGTTDGTISG